jgi:hypothetical protein
MTSPVFWKISRPASSFGSPAVSCEIRGFASPDYSGFAFVGRRSSVSSVDKSKSCTKAVVKTLRDNGTVKTTWRESTG